MRDDLYNELVEDDLDGDLKMIAELCGLEVAVAIFQNLPGTQLSIRNSPPPAFVERYIKGNMHKDRRILAMNLGIHQRRVANTIKSIKEERDAA